MADFDESVVVEEMVNDETVVEKKDYTNLIYAGAGAVAGIGLVALVKIGVELAFPEFCLKMTDKKIAKLENTIKKRQEKDLKRKNRLEAKKAKLELEVVNE